MRSHLRSVTLCGLNRKWVAISAALLLTACGGGGGDEGDATDQTAGTSGAPITLSQPADTSGRLLASNCFQCHGTGGAGGFENIRGNEASEVLDYLTDSASSDIMAAHAQGYSRVQLEAIIAYLKR